MLNPVDAGAEPAMLDAVDAGAEPAMSGTSGTNGMVGNKGGSYCC